MQPIQLLNQHLDEIMLGGKAYPRTKVERVYARLTTPRNTGTFYDANRVRGDIYRDGEVSFKIQYPELVNHLPGGWSHHSPQEAGIKQTSPKPVRGLIGMQKAFQSHLRNPDGSIRSAGGGLYYNQPISEHRSLAYQGQGFMDATDTSLQYLDNRRFQNNPRIAELMMRLDAEYQTPGVAQALREPLLAKHPQLREVVETVHLPVAELRKNTPLLDEDILENIDYGWDWDDVL